MNDGYLPLILAGILGALFGMYLFRPRPRPRPEEPIAFADEREERLTRQVARTVGCSVEEALPAVRHEIGLSPHQSDEVLLKRAAYHYRQNLPDAPCKVFGDRAPG